LFNAKCEISAFGGLEAIIELVRML
jgi:hypothetical protein